MGSVQYKLKNAINKSKCQKLINGYVISDFVVVRHFQIHDRDQVRALTNAASQNRQFDLAPFHQVGPLDTISLLGAEFTKLCH